MSLIDFQLDLSRLIPLLERGVIALERIAGPPPSPQPKPRMATLDDYSCISTDEETRARFVEEALARANMVVPGSEAFIRGVEEYEKQIIASYGDENGALLVAQLPWKRKSQI